MINQFNIRCKECLSYNVETVEFSKGSQGDYITIYVKLKCNMCPNEEIITEVHYKLELA